MSVRSPVDDAAQGFPSGCGSQELVCTRDGAVAVIQFNRPQSLNAITPQMEAELHTAIDCADADESVRAIVLTGDEAAFSSGYDFGAAQVFGTETDRLMHWWNVHMSSPDRHFHLMELGTPVIAAVRGWCLGGGFWYALSADITLAGDDAVFGQPEVRELENSSILLALLAGWKNAYRYSLTGDHFGAAEALRIGIVNEVVPSSEVVVARDRAWSPDRARAGHVGSSQQGLDGDGVGRDGRADRDSKRGACVRGHPWVPRFSRARGAAGGAAQPRHEGIAAPAR